MMKTVFIAVMAAAAAAASGMGIGRRPPTGEEEAQRQARSVHLHWGGLPDNLAEVVGSVTVTEEQTNSYFMVIGFDGGYMGLQNVMGGHVGIFSVWDPDADGSDFSAKESDVAEARRAKVVYADKLVNVSRFGGEGTGAKTMFGYNWDVGKKTTFRVTAEPEEEGRTLITGYVGNESGEVKIAAISIPGHGNPPTIRQVHSFVEDFWRNGLSKTLVRRAEFTDFAGRSAGEKEFHRASAAMFTGDHNTLMSIDAGPVKGGGFLQTGGDTRNVTVPLRGVFRFE